MTKKNLEIQTSIATIKVVDGWPSKNIIPIELQQQFNFRKHNSLEGDNSITIINMHEPVWWLRPFIEDTNTAITLDEDKGYTCMLPFFLGKNHTWKSAYNVLVNKNNLPTLIQLKFEHSLTEEEKNKLIKMSFVVIIQALLNLGVPEHDICCLNNDLLLKGKKFAGSERIWQTNIYTECLFINLKYLEEKNLFDQIYVGKKTKSREITGILDEYDFITKEAFIKAYCEEFKKYLDQFEL